MNKDEFGEQISEAEISMLLDTFMYLDYHEAREGEDLNQILIHLQDHPDYGGGGLHFGEYTILKEAAQNPKIGKLIIDCQSYHMGYNSGTAACCFSDPEKENVFVVFRGTGDGEWPDNGLGMTQKATVQQTQALAYFEEAVEQLEIDDSQRLIITGHSKGGNKAQFVTMETKYDNLLDVCYSIDGQGFSEEAVDNWKSKYGNGSYHERTAKLYGIHGENDYVSVLGNSIIPKEHIRYIKTPVIKSNFAGYHDIKYMFATMEYAEETGKAINIFHGRQNSETMRRGVLGNYAAKLSENIMGLEAEKRDGCSAVIMHLMEAVSGRKDGINDEKTTFSDLMDFAFTGIPLIFRSLFQEKAGDQLLQAAVTNNSFGDNIHGDIRLKIDYLKLDSQTSCLENAADQVKHQITELEDIRSRLSEYRNTGILMNHRMRTTIQGLKKIEQSISKLSQVNHQLVSLYEKWDSLSTEIMENRIAFLTEIE